MRPTSAGRGYNFTTGANSHVSAISIFGAAAHMSTWRDLIERARGRTEGSYAPRLGIVVENWRIGVQGSGTLSFGATTGTGITVTLGTANSIVAADIGKTINVRADQSTGLATVVSITDTTHVVVDITENLVDTSILSGFWALVPDLTDEDVDTYPALASEVALEIATCGGYVDDVSIYGEAYWDPGNLSLRLANSQAGRTDYRTRATDGWNDHAVNLSDTERAARYWAWNNRNLADPAADRILFFDSSGGAGGEGTFAFLSLPAAGITISGTALALANDLAALEGLASTGFAARTAADTWAQRSLTEPAAGLTIANPAGIAGDPTFALANDLAALEGLASTGIAARTAADTWAQRTVTGTAGQIDVANGDGVAGDPTLSLPATISVATSYQVAGTQVVAAQQAAIADLAWTYSANDPGTVPDSAVTFADGAALVAATAYEALDEIEAKINAILAALRAHGLIDT